MENDVYIECGNGWKNLYEPLIYIVNQYGGKIVQIKEKFGGLRFYYDLPEETPEEVVKVIAKLVHANEEFSYYLCEMTGTPGKLRTSKSWIKTLSDEQAEKRGYTISTGVDREAT